jgi:hypothetical protein
VAANTARHGWPNCCTLSTSASVHFHQQSLMLRSPGRPTAMTQAEPVWRILSPVSGVFSPALHVIELCQL